MSKYPDFYTDGHAAILSMIDNSLVPYKDLVYGLWPNKDRAMALFNECKNPKTTQYFKFSELIQLMELSGRYDPLYFACDLLGLERPSKKSTGAEIDRLCDIVETIGLQQANVVELLNTIKKREEVKLSPVAQIESVVDIASRSKFSLENESETASSSVF